MDQGHVQSQDEYTLLHSEIAESYGRVCYSHKIQEKAADNCNWQNMLFTNTQLALAALTTGSALTAIIGPHEWANVNAITAVVSVVLTFLTTYLNSRKLPEHAQTHRASAADYWMVREQYSSLLFDLKAKAFSPVELRRKRDRLLSRTAAINKQAPHTNASAYKAAQMALKIQNEMQFSPEELNHLLPAALQSKCQSGGPPQERSE